VVEGRIGKAVKGEIKKGFTKNLNKPFFFAQTTVLKRRKTGLNGTEKVDGA
jgi:hypothetical protein